MRKNEQSVALFRARSAKRWCIGVSLGRAAITNSCKASTRGIMNHLWTADLEDFTPDGWGNTKTTRYSLQGGVRTIASYIFKTTIAIKFSWEGKKRCSSNSKIISIRNYGRKLLYANFEQVQTCGQARFGGDQLGFLTQDQIVTRPKNNNDEMHVVGIPMKSTACSNSRLGKRFWAKPSRLKKRTYKSDWAFNCQELKNRTMNWMDN